MENHGTVFETRHTLVRERIEAMKAIWTKSKAEYHGDMVKFGIIDPTKVTRLALQNATSVAGLLLTTEAMIAEAPKQEQPPAGGGHGHGGMEGMM